MPYFCIECGMFQHHNEEKCPDCGAKSERATRIDLLNPILKKDGGDESLDEFPEEIVSRSRYLWFKITRPWRRLWRRGLLWRFVLITGSAVIASIPIVGAIYWYDQIRCDPEQSATCIATVVNLVTPVSEEFSARVNETLSDQELALSAEIYDSVMLLALAWLDDQTISPREVVEIAGGRYNKCTSAKICAWKIKNGVDVDYDGASGSVYLSPDGDRGSYLKERRFRKKLSTKTDSTQPHLFGSVSKTWLITNVKVPDTTISILSKRELSSVRQALLLATTDLKNAGISIQIESIVDSGFTDETDDLGNFLVVVDSGFTDETLGEIASKEKVTIFVGSEWRKINNSFRDLQLSATPNLLVDMLLPELKTKGEILLIGRCGDLSPTLADALRWQLFLDKIDLSIRTDCIIEKPTKIDESLLRNPPSTLIIATSYNPLGLYNSLLQSGYMTKIQDVIVIGERTVIPFKNQPTK